MKAWSPIESNADKLISRYGARCMLLNLLSANLT